MTRSTGTFRNYVTYRLEQVARMARETADAVYRERCGLDLRHIRILRIVAETPEQTVNVIVRESRLDRSLVSRIISSLVRRKLVVRTISATDARQFHVSTTPAGAEMVRQANRLGDALNLDVIGVLDPQELKVFERCLAKLAAWRPRDVDAAALGRENG